MPNLKNYLDQPCERCGSKRRVSKMKNEKLITISGTTIIQVSQTTCSNKVCQALFDKNREEELVKINARKLLKEEQDKTRKDNIANSIAIRKKAESKLN